MSDDDRGSRNGRNLLLDQAISLGFIALVVLLAYRIFAPLFPALLWGVLLAIICAHPYERLVSRLHGRRYVADLVFGMILLMVLLVPATFFAWEVIANFPVVKDWVGSKTAPPMPPAPEWLSNLPVIGPSIESAWGAATTDLGNQIPGIVSHLGEVTTWAAGRVGSFGAFLFEFILGSVLSLFILHHRFAVRAFLNRLLVRIGGEFAGGVFARALEMTRSSFTGVIFAAIAQTLLAVLGLYVAGLPGLVIFAGFTFLLALVKIGPLIVLIVADSILLWQGFEGSAALLAIWFFAVVMTVDNVIQPYFSSRGSNLPAVVAFLGTIGGFLSWGLIGVFLGPVLTSVIYELLLAWITATDGEEHPVETKRSDPAQT